jgi:hypothetical protein
MTDRGLFVYYKVFKVFKVYKVYKGVSSRPENYKMLRLVVIKLFTKNDLRRNRQQMISLGLTCDQVNINFPVGIRNWVGHPKRQIPIEVKIREPDRK